MPLRNFFLARATPHLRERSVLNLVSVMFLTDVVRMFYYHPTAIHVAQNINARTCRASLQTVIFKGALVASHCLRLYRGWQTNNETATSLFFG